MSSKKILTVLIVLCSTSCGFVQNVSYKEMSIHYRAGMMYEHKKDYISAREQFYKALVDARSGDFPAETVSMLMYEFGRNTGYACHLSESESYLKKSLNMENSFPNKVSRNIAIRNFELARLMYDQNRFSESSVYYESALNELEKSSGVESAPITFSGIYMEYSDALLKSGSEQKAKIALKRAEELSHKPPENNPERSFIRYKCEHVL